MSINHSVGAGDGGRIPIYRTAPAKPGPGLVIVPSIFGVASDVVGHADHFTAHGALVYAMDPFWRTVPGPLVFGPDTMPAALDRMAGHDVERGHADVRDVIAAAGEDPSCNGKVVCLGICFGGKFAFLAAADGVVAGAATWHGGGLEPMLDRAADIQVPLELDFGGDDPMIPNDEVDRIRAAFADQPHVNIRNHPGASHGFSHVGSAPYHQVANAAGVSAVEAILKGLST